MGLEVGTYISDLVATNPVGATDPKAQGDDHLRLLKSTIKATFPNISGAMTASHTELNKLDGVTATTAELNYLVGVTSAIQTQLDAKLASASYTAADVLAKLLTVDGAGSSLDADTLDTLSSAAFAQLAAANVFTGGNLSVISGVVGNRSVIIQNSTDSTTSASQLYMPNSSNRAIRLVTTAASWSGSLLTGGPTGEQGALSTDSNIPMAYGRNGAVNFWFDTSDNLNTRNLAATEIGFKGIPRLTDTASYTFTLADAGKLFDYRGTGGHTVTIPANGSVAYPLGTVLTIVNLSSNNSNLTIAITTDTMYLEGTALATTGSRTLAVGSTARAIKLGSQTWLISGTGLS